MAKQLAQTVRRLSDAFSKYKYAIIVLFAGVLLMCWPEAKPVSEETVVAADSDCEYSLQEQMEQLLSNVEGAGDVKVLLSLKNGVTRRYQENTETYEEGESSRLQTETVFRSINGDDLPVEVQIEYPTYTGAVVVCQGADKPSVKLSIILAVKSLTGLNADEITVIKMKDH